MISLKNYDYKPSAAEAEPQSQGPGGRRSVATLLGRARERLTLHGVHRLEGVIGVIGSRFL